MGAALLTLGIVGLGDANAGADPDVTGGTTDVGGHVEVDGSGDEADHVDGASGRPARCTYYLQDSANASLPFGLAAGEKVSLAEVRATAEVETIVIRICRWLDNGEIFGGPVVVPPNPGLLARRAAEHAAADLVLPLPSAALSPVGIAVVNLPVKLTVDPGPAAPRSASAGGVTATVTATPGRAIWRPGDGETIVCDPGTAVPTSLDQPPGGEGGHEPTGCTHRYRDDGDLESTITQVWRLGWIATNGEQGDLGEVSRTSVVPVAIRELEVVLRSP